MAIKCVVIFNPPLIGGEALALLFNFTFDVKLNTSISDAKELEDTFVMCDPGSEGHPVSAEDHIAFVCWDVIECYGVWLNSTSSHLPNLIAASSVVEVLVMSSVWHMDCRVDIIPGELWEFREA